MFGILIFIVIGLFAALLFLNVYFRIKVIKVYKVLRNNEVEFGASHIFDSSKMEAEILPRYPKFRSEIVSFARHIKYSIRIAVVLILLITILGVILNYFE